MAEPSSRRVIEPVLSLAQDRPALSFDAFEEQQRILLAGQERALAIHNEQMNRLLCLSSVACTRTNEMLEMVMKAAADLAAQAVAAADAARERTKEAQAENAKATLNPLLDVFAAWAKEKGFM